MSSNCSTCSKGTIHCVVWNVGRAAGGALGRCAASTAEAVRGRVALTCHQCGAAGSAGARREARARGGRGFCWAKKVRSQLGIGPDGEISCAPILTSFMHMTLVYVTTPSFPVYRAYLKILVFRFIRINLVVANQKFRFQGALNNCMQVLRENWPMHVLYACMHCN